MQYQINGLGQRIAKLKNKPSHPDNDDDCADEFHVKGVTDFVYDKDGHLIGEYTRNGKPIRETVYLGDTPVAVLVGKAQYFIYADHLNTPRVITDTRNRVVWRWDASDPFGATPPNENPSGRGTFTFNLRFPGQYFDQETGLHYNYFRDYDPGTGRYIESDPIGLQGVNANLYWYALNNPINFIDPLGLITTVIITRDYGFGTHAAVYITNNSDPYLFDPSGSYLSGQRRGSGDYFSDGEADKAALNAFIKYHQNEGSTVELYRINTTLTQEAEIVKQIINYGGGGFAGCARGVSNVLGVCGISPTVFPGSLADQLKVGGGKCAK
jgi:RHS repeat-associated protein